MDLVKCVTARAFTLIELLVVVAIVVVLLSLLVPAMDRAVYQAELAVCAANQKGIGAGVVSYAMESKRFYPRREHLLNWYSVPLVINYTLFGQSLDDRPMLRPYLSINKSLRCPLQDEVNLDTEDPDTMVYAGYNLWFGMQYRANQGFNDLGQVAANNARSPGMFKLGNRWGFQDTNHGQKPVRSSVLANDRYLPNPDKGAVHSSHPGDGYFNDVKREEVYGISPKGTISLWSSLDARAAGAVDLNVLFDDVSVRRYADVRWDINKNWLSSEQGRSVDGRFVSTPAWNNSIDWDALRWWEVTPRQ